MATVKKLIGKLPVYKGDWVAGTYSMLNQVSYLGSTFQSKIDNNTSQPATLVNNVLQVNSNWSVVSNGTAAYLADSRISTLENNRYLKKVGEYTFLNDRRIVGVESVDFANKTVRTKEPHGITTTTGNDSVCYFVLKNSIDAQVFGNDDTFKYASESLNIANKPTSIIDEYTLSFNGMVNNSNADFDASYYDMYISSDNNYQRSIALSESCNEYKVIVKLSKYNGGIGDLDSSGGTTFKRSAGSSVTEYCYYNSGMYSTRCVLISHFGRSPKFNGTTQSVNTNYTHYAFDRRFTNRNPISQFQFYNYSLPYIAGDKVEIYKIS